MKRKLTFLLTAVLLLATHLSLKADEVTYVMSSMGWTDAQVIGSGTFDSHFSYNSGTGDDGATAGPKYYANGSAVRFYAKNGGTGHGNWMQISPISGYTITGIELTAISSYTPTVKCVVDSGTEVEMTLSGTTYSITGISATDRVKFWDAAVTNTQLRITQIKVTYTSGGSTPTVATPTFSPTGGTYFETQSVSIACTTEGATIRYTTDGSEPTESSAVYSAPISVSTTTTLKAKGFKTGSTPSAVASATYTIVSISEISSITAAGTYAVQGTIVAKSQRGFIVGDGTGYVYYYNQSYSQSSYNIGDMVRLSGSVVAYGGVFEFNNTTTVTTATSSNYVAEDPTVITGAEMDARVASATPAQLSSYVQYVGTLTVSGTYYNITDIDGATTAKGSISFPLSTDFTSLNGQEVVVTGYYVGVSSSQYYNTMIGSIEENVVLNPTLAVTPTQLSGFQYTFNAGPSQSQSFTVTGSDLSENATVTAPQDFEVNTNSNGVYNNSLTLTPEQGAISSTIYVRMKAGLAVGNHTGNVTVTCGTLSQSIAVSGTVSEQPQAESPTFSPAGGNFITAQTVSLSCTTEGATIYYTTDGSTPTTGSTAYSQPITVSSMTTIKAIAAAEGYQNSAVVEATYTINEPITIAAARALENNAYACVEGTVIFLDGRNVYIQDNTAGIDLYLNTNTVPTTLALGDNVRVYGKKTAYNGLVELTAIAGNNANVFTIISTGNTLPLATKTIAEINTDYSGSNLLQATRVKVEHAIIGAINPSGTTVISQEGNTMNVYHIPTVQGMIQGDWVTITGVIGCYNAPQLLVASADDIQYTHRPVLTATPASLSGFTYDYDEGGPSDIQNFNLAGSYLLGPVSVIPSESFEVSTFPGTTFHPENPAMVFPPSAGSFFGIGIYVRLKAGLEGGDYNEQIAVVSQDADTLFVNVTGTVTGGTPPTPPDPPTPPTPGDGNYVRISDLGQLADGSYVVFAARFDDNANDYYAMTASSSGKPTGVLFTSATANENEVLPASIVDEEDTYYWIVGVTTNGYTFTNASGELIGHSSSTNFATGGDNTEWSVEWGTSVETAMVPNYSAFVITNINNDDRAFALNTSHNFGPYSKSNMSNNNAGNYNFYLDIFVKTEGGDPPMPTVATPTFTPEGGTYFEEQTVSIACATEGATIYYSAVSDNGPWTVYTTPITVSESMTIWAYAEKDGYNNSTPASATYTIQMGFVTIFNQDWEGEMNGWTFVDVDGEMEWVIAEHNGNHYAYANGYNHGANEDWCISPVFNLDTYSNPSLSFRTATKFDGNVLQVMFSSDYNGEDPTAATWTELTCDLSTGNYTWVESGSIDLSSFSGTECYIGFKYTCEESQAAAWEVDDIMLIGQTSEPVVTVTPLVLTGFTYVEGNGPSDEQSFTVSGLNLSGSITVTPSTNYEISQTSGSGFTSNYITLEPTGGNVEDATIFVRLIAGLAVDDYNENITVSCDDVENIIIACSGNVTEQPVPGDDYVRISGVSELAAGNRVILAARYNDTEDAYLAITNTLTSGKFATTEFTSAMNGSDEIIPAEILLTEDDYYWTVDVTSDGYTFTNANGQVLSYGSSTNFNFTGTNTTWTIETGVSDTASMVPEYFGFNIANFTNNTRAFAVRYYNEDYICGAYSTSNMNNGSAGEYNFFLDIFMQGEGGTCTVAAPTFDPAGGVYYETQDVVISCTTADATIYYSLDSETGPWNEYEEAITVDESMTIWAYAVKEGCNDSPVVSAEYIIQDDIVVIFNQDWEDDWNGWTEVLVYGDSLWRIASYQGNHYAYANGYNHPATEDWLISPEFNLDSYSDVVLNFRTAMNYTGLDLDVFFSNDYDGEDPTIATWTQLPCELSTGSWNWVSSGDISLDEFSGTSCHIGFRYQCTDDEAAGWEVDDIMLTSGGGAIPTPTLTATPNTINGLDYLEGEGPSESQSYTLTGANLEGEGDVVVTASEYFQISLDDEEYFFSLSLPFADGELVDQPVTIYVRLIEGLEVGTYEGTITHEGGNATEVVSLSGTVHSEDEPMMEALMPLYVQGNNGSNNNRVPMAAPVYFTNLEPNATYRYTNQFVVSDDGPETAGAGNVIYVNTGGFYRSTNPSLSTEGGYGEFTTDEYGEAIVFLMNEPTANARFTPGNQVYMRVRINDGHEGTSVEQTFTSVDYATVLNFGNENDEYSGSAFYVKSNEPSMSFAFMFANEGDDRPVYSTSIETIDVDFGSINQYADFYKELVAGNDGWFGGILPNDNETGINYIATIDLTYEIGNEYFTENGEWMPEAYTINPTNGLDEPIFIDLTDDDVDDNIEANVKVLSVDHEFVIENGDNAHYSMTVYNILGQPMMTKQINAGSSVRISHSLASGVYVISLQNNQNTVSVKVIVR